MSCCELGKARQGRACSADATCSESWLLCCTHMASCVPAAAAAGSESWLLSLGPYSAPAGSTLVLQLSYRASFGQRQGLWRSAAYPSTARPGQQVVALSTALEPSAARMVLPCLDEPRYKVRVRIRVIVTSLR
jgi:hypothetical protein